MGWGLELEDTTLSKPKEFHKSQHNRPFLFLLNEKVKQTCAIRNRWSSKLVPLGIGVFTGIFSRFMSLSCKYYT